MGTVMVAIVKVLLVFSALMGVQAMVVGKMKITVMTMRTWVMERSKTVSATTIATASKMYACSSGGKVACRRPVAHVLAAVAVVVPRGRAPRKAAARAKAVAVAGLARTEETMARIGPHLGACALL